MIQQTDKRLISWSTATKLVRVLSAGVLVGTMVLQIGCASERKGQSNARNNETEIVVVTSAVAEESYDVVRHLPGTTTSELNSILSSSVTGRVDSVNVSDGSHVTKGQSLVVLDQGHLIAGKNIAAGSVVRERAEVLKAKAALDLERASCKARIKEAEAVLEASKAALAMARERRSVTNEGARSQELAQAKSSVVQADASVKLATLENDRMRGLFQAGAVAQRDVDRAGVGLDQALAQRNIALQQLMLLEEGSRQQDRSVSGQAVVAAEATVRQAEAGVLASTAALKQIEVREADVKSSRAELSSAVARVADANVSLNDSTVRAPFDGYIVRRIVDPGTLASSGSPLLEIAGGKRCFDTNVPAALIRMFKAGNKIRVSVAPVHDGDMMAVVSQITPQSSGRTHSYKVRLTLPDNITPLIGLYGIAKISITRRKGILLDDVSIHRCDGLTYVYVITPTGRAQSRVVTLGSPVSGKYPVTSGLAPGDVIVREIVPGLVDGVRVREGRS